MTDTQQDTATTQSQTKKSKGEEIFTDREYVQSIGRRKTASAQIRLYADGKGRIYVNKVEYRKYFPFFTLQKSITKALDLLKEKQNVDVSVKVNGGGTTGQADAISLGIARALSKVNAEYKEKLRQSGMLTRNPRKKERKKPGLKRARRAPQWAKR